MEFTKKSLFVALFAFTLMHAAAGAALPQDAMAPAASTIELERLRHVYDNAVETLDARRDQIINANAQRLANINREIAQERADIAARRVDADAQRLRQVAANQAMRDGVHNRFGAHLFPGLPAIDPPVAGAVAVPAALPRGAALQADLLRRNNDAARIEAELAAEQIAARERDERAYLAVVEVKLIGDCNAELREKLEDVVQRLAVLDADYEEARRNVNFRVERHAREQAAADAVAAAAAAQAAQAARSGPRRARAAAALAAVQV